MIEQRFEKSPIPIWSRAQKRSHGRNLIVQVRIANIIRQKLVVLMATPLRERISRVPPL